MVSIKVMTSDSRKRRQSPPQWWVRDSFGSQSVEIDFVVAPQFEMFDPLTASEDIEGDVQDVVGFVIGKMDLEELKLGVDVADQANPGQQQHDTDAAGVRPWTRSASSYWMLVAVIIDKAARDRVASQVAC